MTRLFSGIIAEVLLFLLFIGLIYPILNSFGSDQITQKEVIRVAMQTIAPVMLSVIPFLIIFADSINEVEHSAFNFNLVKTTSITQAILFSFLFFDFNEFSFKYDLAPSFVLFFTCYYLSFITSMLFILYLKKDIKNFIQELKTEGWLNTLAMPITLITALSTCVYLSFFDFMTFNLMESVKDIPVITYFVLTQISGIVISYIFYSNNFFDNTFK